ncbi:MAG: signal peptidase I [Lachnospiraceae bacterium]
MSNLTFGKEKKRFNFDIIRTVLVWAFQIAVVCTIAFVLVWYFGQRVSNIGDSMKPVLSNGDVTLVNRIVYNASRPKRNDIIVFKPNGNENSHFYIKRIIGLPGETIEMKDGAIYIDQKKLKEEFKTTKLDNVGIVTEAMTLGGNEYFVLGDNRKSSEDSRMADIGNVKNDEIYGKAWFVISPGARFGFIKK